MFGANERAIRWAHNPNVKTGDWKLASYHQRWYIIEKFDDTDLKYQVTKFVRQNEFNNVKKQWEEQYGKSFEEDFEREYNTIDDYHRKTTPNGKRGSVINADVLEYSEENKGHL